jgi:glycosyltransferase involved in cell wall biosynthesis
MIIFVHLLNDSSGSPRVLKSAIEAFGSKGNQLFVGSDGRGILEATGIAITRYSYRRSRWKLITLISYLFSQAALFFRLARSGNIDRDAVVYVNTLLPFGAALWGRRTGRRVVYHLHEVSVSPRPLRWFLSAIAERTASQIIYVSEDHRRRLPINSIPSITLHNPVDSSIVKQGNATEYTPRRSGAFNVLMLASLRGYKGINEFMALAEELQKRADISFDLVLNAEADDVAAFSRRHSDAANVTIHPRTDDPAQFYSKADLVLNLSRVAQWIETFGLTLVEAMTFGLPVIAPPVGGPAEIVTHGIEGYCIDSRDGAALHEAVLKLADDPETYDAMARAARKRAQDFSFEAYAAALRAAINTLGEK